jgi:hypothetical protein
MRSGLLITEVALHNEKNSVHPTPSRNIYLAVLLDSCLVSDLPSYHVTETCDFDVILQPNPTQPPANWFIWIRWFTLIITAPSSKWRTLPAAHPSLELPYPRRKHFLNNLETLSVSRPGRLCPRKNVSLLPPKHLNHSPLAGYMLTP